MKKMMMAKNYNHTHHRHLHQGVLLFVWDPFGDFKIRTRSKCRMGFSVEINNMGLLGYTDMVWV